MLLIPKSTFLLRVEANKRTIARKGVKIEVSEAELQKLPGKFIIESPPETKPGVQGLFKKK